MTLQSIKPEDKAWVASKATTSIRDLFNDLEKQFNDLNESILKGKMSNEHTAKAISAIRHPQQNVVRQPPLLTAQDKGSYRRLVG
jgi:hypothetical protein